ncbi:MAG: hypothetical protein M0Q44_11060 [Methylobacter sp.]|jgi:hypothetical protein|nr:hypothetical protein [Methylobacter sp.]
MTEEKECIVAFIDILGFGSIMRSSDVEIRLQAISLLEKIRNYSSQHELKVDGYTLSYSVEVSTFSDNVVISMPLTTEYGDDYYHSDDINKFIKTLFYTIKEIVWEGLHLGLIFRGAITKGRLYHNKNVVAGEALVRAVEMEKEAIYPRIEIHEDVIGCKNTHGIEIIDKDMYERIKQENGKFYLNSLAWNRCFFHPKPTSENEILLAIQKIEKIKSTIDEQIEKLKDDEKCKSKWIWLKKEFSEEEKNWLWNKVTPLLTFPRC